MKRLIHTELYCCTTGLSQKALNGMSGVVLKTASGPEDRSVVRLTTGKMLRIKQANLEVGMGVIRSIARHATSACLFASITPLCIHVCDNRTKSLSCAWKTMGPS